MLCDLRLSIDVIMCEDKGCEDEEDVGGLVVLGDMRIMFCLERQSCLNVMVYL